MPQMKIVQEFKEFILKGNMVDLAVGIIIGAAFGAVVKSLVDNVMMPPMGYLLGGIDFAEYKYKLAEPIAKGETHPITQVEVLKDVPGVFIQYGLFINSMITLLIQGLAVFFVIKVINSMKREQEKNPVAAPTPVEVELLREIRDELRGGSRSADPASRVQGSPPESEVV